MDITKQLDLNNSDNKVKKRVSKKTKKPQLIIENDDENNEDNLDIQVKNEEGLLYLSTIANSSVDLILTDPPYIISKDSGMNEHYKNVKSNEENNVAFVKTEIDWDEYKKTHNIETDENKENYIKYGTIYGKKYCVQTDYGTWDNEFTMEILEKWLVYRIYDKWIFRFLTFD
jgi:site-specific DNA-methyltransferase (adenine-specific)